ncbi:MAG: hypothetical protein O6766_04240 [Gammaproteobacteria bacterium]|jgi:hypothetical protein|nr:hypothetical protein [Gammaproteobacteria bacterium]
MFYRDEKMARQMNYQDTNETKSTMINDMRLSRLSHPRATLVAMVLLAIVFLTFGVFAQAMQGGVEMPAPNTIQGALVLVSDWAFGA